LWNIEQMKTCSMSWRPELRLPMSLASTPGQVGPQELVLELSGIVLVLQVLEQEDGDGNAAHRIDAEDDDCPRNGADVAATGLPVVDRVDHAQELVGQRKSLRIVFETSEML
jgi:hypothetical protein